MTVLSESTSQEEHDELQGKRVAFLGRLSGMSKRDAARIVREQGATAIEKSNATVDLLVIADDLAVEPLLAVVESLGDNELATAARQGTIQLLSESEFWQLLGMVDLQQDVRQWVTPAMLAHILDVPVGVVRRWRRRGLIVPTQEAHRLPYFNFEEVNAARLLSQLFRAGCSLNAIEQKVAELRRLLSDVSRPLVTMPFVVEDRRLLLRRGEDLTELGGQLRIDYEAIEQPLTREAADLAISTNDGSQESKNAIVAFAPSQSEHQSEPASHLLPDEMVNQAEELESEGKTDEAIEIYRAALIAIEPTAGGSRAEINFQLAEALYRQGDLLAARERYYCVLELEEDYVEARSNLGCVLAETNQKELAVAAFEGALSLHPEYSDARYHLARTLVELGRHTEATIHWRAFLSSAPESPWADEARAHLEEADYGPSS